MIFGGSAAQNLLHQRVLGGTSLLQRNEWSHLILCSWLGSESRILPLWQESLKNSSEKNILGFFWCVQCYCDVQSPPKVCYGWFLTMLFENVYQERIFWALWTHQTQTFWWPLMLDALQKPRICAVCTQWTQRGWPPLARRVLGILQVPSIAAAFILQWVMSTL